MNGREERELVLRLYFYGWIVFLALLGASLALFPMDVTAGTAVGGLLVMGNLHLLRRTVLKALVPGNRVTPGSVLPFFYLCFILTGAVIFVLISQHIVNGLGLLLGLSVFIVNVFLVVARLTGKIVYKTIMKEAV